MNFPEIGPAHAREIKISKRYWISFLEIRLCLTRETETWEQFPAKKLVPYVLSQTIGPFLSSCLVYSACIDMDLTEANATIFVTYPRDGVSIG